MRKNEFLKDLNRQLEFLNKSELEEVMEYYEELIQDAVDHGEIEKEFIDSLGEVSEIAFNIKKDGSFLEKVRARVPFSVKEVFGLTVKIVGYFFFTVFTIVFVSIAFSLVTAGISLVGGGIIAIFTATSSEAVYLLLRASIIVLGMGIFIFGIGLFKWYAEVAKKTLMKLLHQVKELFK